MTLHDERIQDEEAHVRTSQGSDGTDGTNAPMASDPAQWTEKFAPFPEMKPPDEDAALVTFRAVLVGILCGALVNGSNIYLGLKTGWTSSANLLGVCRRALRFPPGLPFSAYAA